MPIPTAKHHISSNSFLSKINVGAKSNANDSPMTMPSPMKIQNQVPMAKSVSKVSQTMPNLLPVSSQIPIQIAMSM